MDHGDTELDRRFEAIVFDWDGTAVPDRRVDASAARAMVEELCALGMDMAVVSGTHVGNVDGQLQARPSGPGRLLLLLNRGSEVFEVGAEGPSVVHRREATRGEDRRLTEAAELTVRRLADRGLRAEIVSRRLNRRKIDLIPEPEWADPPKARIGELLNAVEERLSRSGLRGLPEVVDLAMEASREAGLPDPRVTSDAKHVEIGLTDKSDSGRWIIHDLWRVGVGARQIVIAGDEMGPLGGLPGSDSLLLVPEAEGALAVSVGAEPTGVPDGVLHLPGGPERFLALLEDQAGRRRARSVPELDGDEGWTVAVEGLDPELERSNEAMLTLADGRFGTSGAPLLDGAGTNPSVLASGGYRGEGPSTELLPGPLWTLLGSHPDGHDPVIRRTLHLRTGLLRHELRDARGTARALLLSSLARPGIVALRAEGSPALLDGPGALRPPEGAGAVQVGQEGERPWIRVIDGPASIAAAAAETRGSGGGGALLERLAAYVAAADRSVTSSEAVRALESADGAGFETLLHEHRAAWAGRWEDADVRVEGDPELQLAVRFCLFHLMGSVPSRGEAAVGARGLSGPAYRGHVFWDADVFVLPFLAATHPPAARAMLQYRVKRLPAARAAARRAGRDGARFPWESALTGEDVTPELTVDRRGRRVAVRTGHQEEHVVADVAWGAASYIDWTGDRAFAEGPGRDLLVETARYWASRARVDDEGLAHIERVIGPDEYHEDVDDNAFTNVMARWNLRRAAGEPGIPRNERARWLGIAEALVDGYDPLTGLYEQFRGFFDLEPLIISEAVPRRPIAADILFPPDRLSQAQIVKQADVLMLHHLVPEEVEPDSLRPNVEFYEPRTSHGSSLSPGIHASVLARAGLLDEALGWLRLTSLIDLGDLTKTSAGGVHVASMGSLWQALAMGFAGIRPSGDALLVDPALAPGWERLEVPVRFRGSRVRVLVEPDAFTVTADPPTRIRVGAEAEPVGPEGRRFGRT